MVDTNDVLFSEHEGQGGNLGLITLNRPQALNALNHDMILAMSQQLRIWQQASHIKAVIIQSSGGRAFCAGGDLRQTYDRIKNRDPKMIEFFRDEYQLNRLIFHFKKPYIALLNGITMGGGAGISVHGSHRIATDRLLFAMPETGIGFFPDVGGTYFLSHLHPTIGCYLGLSGARINADDCVAIGIATQKIDEASLPACVDALAQTDFGDQPIVAVTNIVNQFKMEPQSSALVSHEKAIKSCFGPSTMIAVYHALQRSDNPLCQEALAHLKKKSPLSLMITFKALQDAAEMTFDDCMQQEYRLVSRFLLGHDFIEGIRAVIIDKDQNPQWDPTSLEAVEPNEIIPYFAPLSLELS